jgi:hypothetical protein
VIRSGGTGTRLRRAGIDGVEVTPLRVAPDESDG